MKLSQVAAGVLATIAMLLFPVLASADSAHGAGGGGGGGDGNGGGGDAPDPGPKPAKIKLKLKGLHNGKAKVGDRIEAVGTVTPFVGHQRVEIRLGTSGDTVMKKTPYVHQVKGKSFGRFKLQLEAADRAGQIPGPGEQARHQRSGRRRRRSRRSSGSSTSTSTRATGARR